MALDKMAEYRQAAATQPGGPGAPPSEHGARTVLDHRRNPEHLRPVSESPHDGRKHPLSPLSPETFHVMQAYQRAHDHESNQRIAEYLGTGRYQPPPPGGARGGAEFGPPNPRGSEPPPRSMFEHRISPEDSEQARLLRERERYMQQSGALPPRSNVYRGSPPPPHSAPQPHHSANLVLGTADGSIIGPLPSFEGNRTTDHKR